MSPGSMPISAVALLLLTSQVSGADQPPIRKIQQQGLQCDPLTVRLGDTLRIRFPLPHGGDFAIVSPNGEYLFIAFGQSDSSSPIQPVLPANVFSGMAEISVKINEVKGIPWSKQGPGSTRIFTISGVYKILVSESLETEDPVLDGWCHVSFRR
jgi:hypothetical protein